MHSATSAVMICAALRFLAMLATGDSIRLDGKCRCLNRIESISFQVRTFLSPLQPEGVAVVAVEKRKKKSGGGGWFSTGDPDG